MVFKELCLDYIKLHKKLFWSYLVIASLFYMVKVLVTPMIYSNIMEIEKNGFMSIMKQIFAIWILIGVFYIIKMKMENIIFTEFLSFSRRRLLRLFLEKNKSDFKDANVSSDIIRIFEVTRYMKEVFAWVSQSILPVSIITVIINGYFIYNVPLLGAINLLGNFTIFKYVEANYKKLVNHSNNRENEYMEMIKKFDENFNNLLNIYLNNQIEQTLTNNENIEKDYTKTYKSTNQEVINFINIFKSIIYVFAMISLFVLYKQKTNNTNTTTETNISNKQFITILFIFTFYISTLENISEDIPLIIMTVGNIRNAEPFLEGAMTMNKRDQHLANFQGNIKFDKISFRYDANSDYIFKDFSMDIPKGRRIGIVGKTGKGKSTLMKLLLNFYQLESGNIYLDGVDSKEIVIDDIRKHINYVNQKTTLFNDSILNNMKYGNNASDEDVINLLNIYDLMQIFDNVETIVEKNGANISLGMQKVIFLVRGILKDCKLFIFDEPFTSIDQKTRGKVLRLIDEKTRGKTVIVITHDTEGFDKVLDKMIEL